MRNSLQKTRDKGKCRLQRTVAKGISKQTHGRISTERENWQCESCQLMHPGR